MGLGYGCVEQVQVAGDVGHGAHGRARVVGDGLLFNRNDGGESVNEVDVGLGGLGDEAFGVGGERLHIAALAFRVNGVEGEAGFAGAGESCDHDEFVARDFDGDVLQIVDARSLNGDRLACRADFSRCHS